MLIVEMFTYIHIGINGIYEWFSTHIENIVFFHTLSGEHFCVFTMSLVFVSPMFCEYLPRAM